MRDKWRVQWLRCLHWRSTLSGCVSKLPGLCLKLWLSCLSLWDCWDQRQVTKYLARDLSFLPCHLIYTSEFKTAQKFWTQRLSLSFHGVAATGYLGFICHTDPGSIRRQVNRTLVPEEERHVLREENVLIWCGTPGAVLKFLQSWALWSYRRWMWSLPVSSEREGTENSHPYF